MPELPEITVLARQMKAELIGKTFVGTLVSQPKCLNLSPQSFTAALTGAQILDVTHHGKWIYVETNRGWLYLNLGMGGEIILTTHDALPEKHRLILDFADGSCLSINFWWLGSAHFVAPDQRPSHPMTFKLGPNALDLSLNQFRALLAGRKGGIKSFLLNQRRIAGIGNVYVQDPLFLARIHPLRKIPSLTDDEVTLLWHALRNTLQESIDCGASWFEMDLYGNKGNWDTSFLKIAYREGKPCPVCGTTVVKIKTGSTSTHICPTCQPMEP